MSSLLSPGQMRNGFNLKLFCYLKNVNSAKIGKDTPLQTDRKVVT